MAVAEVRPIKTVLLLICLALAACGETAQSQQEILRLVRVVTIEELASDEPVSLSGVVRAEKEVDLAFRIGGRLVERTPGTGDQVATGQVVAQLDPEDETNSLKIAKSSLVAAEAQLVKAEANYERQKQLHQDGCSPRQRYENVLQVMQAARSQVDAARAQLKVSRRPLDDT